MERMNEKCGVVGVYAPRLQVGPTAVRALHALQHRGQESAGICIADGGRLSNSTGMGLVSQVFGPDEIKNLSGSLAIGHTRYSTTGSSSSENAQPFVVSGSLGDLALAHNGNLVNVQALRAAVAALRIRTRSATDSELAAHLIAHAPGATWRARMRHALAQLDGAFSLVMLSRDSLFAARDPWGIRPLVLGRIPGGWLVASETCALDAAGASLCREIAPGELVEIGPQGLSTEQFAPPAKRAGCSFEFIYFARADSRMDGRLVYRVRERIGEELAIEQPAQADFVMPVPDSATPIALGYARAAGLPYREGLVRDRYVGRTFIDPDAWQRAQRVDQKFNPMPEVLRGQRVVLVDDSIVRGTTTARLVGSLRKAGAAEVHLRIGSPPIRHACYLGVDTAQEGSLIAHGRSIEEIQGRVDADSLGYLSLAGLARAVQLPGRTLCNACFHGRYPMPVTESPDTLALDMYPPVATLTPTPVAA
jgi:amidophosphoribosyltransferase